jgi:hypothetical protein
MITLGHEDPKMIERAKDAFANGRFLNEFIPCPAELNDDDLTTWSRGPEQEVRDKKKAALKEKYGYESWYDWNIANYGTKWDVGNGQGINTWDDHEFIAYFDSAWAPPIAAYEKLEDLGFRVYATYYEPGSAFAGIYGDNCYDLAGMSANEAHDSLPPELNDAFGISDAMYEQEAENEDEVTTWYKEGVEATGLEPHKVKDEQ